MNRVTRFWFPNQTFQQTPTIDDYPLRATLPETAGAFVKPSETNYYRSHLRKNAAGAKAAPGLLNNHTIRPGGTIRPKKRASFSTGNELSPNPIRCRLQLSTRQSDRTAALSTPTRHQLFIVAQTAPHSQPPGRVVTAGDDNRCSADIMSKLQFRQRVRMIQVGHVARRVAVGAAASGKRQRPTPTA